MFTIINNTNIDCIDNIIHSKGRYNSLPSSGCNFSSFLPALLNTFLNLWRTTYPCFDFNSSIHTYLELSTKTSKYLTPSYALSILPILANSTSHWLSLWVVIFGFILEFFLDNLNFVYRSFVCKFLFTFWILTWNFANFLIFSESTRVDC